MGSTLLMRVGKYYSIPAVAACSLLANSAISQTPVAAYPAKPVRVIVGLAPGGANDVQARWYAQKLTERMGKPFIVDNRAGAGGLVAVQIMASAPADGYTVLVASPSFTITPALQDSAAYDPVKDHAPISLLSKAPYLVVVAPAFPAKSIKELIALARAKPDELIMGVAGGTSIHLGAVWLAHATRTRFTIVTYKGNAPAQADVLGGQVHGTLANVLSAMPQIKAGRLRALAVTSAERSSVLPELPTVAESGLPGYDVTTWHAWVAARGTPPAIIRRLNAELAGIVKAPEIAARLADDGAVAVASSPEQLGLVIADEVGRWKKLVRETGLKL